MVPNSEVLTYMVNSDKYWGQALEMFTKREIEKAAELAWGSVAERIKNLALVKSNAFLRSHANIRDYVKRIAAQISDEELYQLFLVAQRLHVEFYESHLDADDVNRDLLSVRKLLLKIDTLMQT